jgi:hypothetical protein
LQGIQAKILALRERDFSAAHVHRIAHVHGAGAVAFKRFHDHRQIVQFKFIVRHSYSLVGTLIALIEVMAADIF